MSTIPPVRIIRRKPCGSLHASPTHRQTPPRKLPAAGRVERDRAEANPKGEPPERSGAAQTARPHAGKMRSNRTAQAAQAARSARHYAHQPGALCRAATFSVGGRGLFDGRTQLSARAKPPPHLPAPPSAGHTHASQSTAEPHSGHAPPTPTGSWSLVIRHWSFQTTVPGGDEYRQGTTASGRVKQSPRLHPGRSARCRSRSSRHSDLFRVCLQSGTQSSTAGSGATLA